VVPVAKAREHLVADCAGGNRKFVHADLAAE
jgi:hypothetical protein